MNQFVLTLLVISICFLSAVSQSPLDRLVENEWTAGYTVDFRHDIAQQDRYRNVLRDHLTFAPDPALTERIHEDRPMSINAVIPTPEGPYELSLVRKPASTDDMIIETADGSGLENIILPVLYRGTINGKPGSFATLTFTSDGITGIMSSKETGNINIISVPKQQYCLVYREQDAMVAPGNGCQPQEVPGTASNLNEEVLQEARGNDACIRVQVDFNYDLFTAVGSSIQQAINYSYAIFNSVSAFYANEDITVRMSYLKIWNEYDRFYADNSLDALYLYADYIGYELDNMQGDVAHLFSNAGYGGRAYLDILCNSLSYYKTGVSALTNNFANYPVYSLSVMLLVHELGHNLGSRHTHACVWNGNNTQIDDCGNILASPGDGTGICFLPGDDPIIPENGGTIMSYCQGVAGVGINFAAGFGEQPGDLIRQRRTLAAMSGCISECTLPCASIEYDLDSIVCEAGQVGETTIHLQTWSGCDSIIHLSKKLIQVNTSALVCQIELVGIDTQILFHEVRGCDTMVITEYVYDGTNSEVVFHYIPTCVQSLDNQYISSTWLVNQSDCDSLVQSYYEYRAIPPTTVEQIVCSYSETETVTDTIETFEGCDSVVTVVSAPLYSFSSVTVCNYALDGLDTQIVASSGGCDSLVITDHIVDWGQIDVIEIFVSTCDPDSNEVYVEEWLTNTSGCDSVLVYHYQYLEIPYNGLDDDCNPQTLDDDLDMDGFLLAEDCNDDEPGINPGTDEIPYNGIDDDCDPTTRDDDLDGDGYLEADDCDDNDAAVNPGVPEIPDNDVDENCDGADYIVSTIESELEAIRIYPNPTADVIRIEVPESMAFELFLFDLTGRLIHKAKNPGMVDLSLLSPGKYLVGMHDLENQTWLYRKILKL